MPTNDFIGFASSGSANIMSQADFAAAAEQGIGVQPGPASSKLANKIWRQGTNMAAALGQIIVNQGLDALDNGDINALSGNLLSALSSILLPLSGGTMSGTIQVTTTPALTRHTDSSYLTLCGGTTNNIANGAFMYLYGASGSQPGAFRIYTGVNSHNLFGKSDGTLTWDNNTVEVVTAKNLGDTGYMRYKSGLLICWGVNVSPSTGDPGNTVTFPVAYKTAPCAIVARRSGGNTTGAVDVPWVREPTTTSMNIYVPVYTGYYWIAIGEGA